MCLPQVLTHNLGIPIIVCACKADALETLMNEQRISSEQIDFIQAYLRRFCLRYQEYPKFPLTPLLRRFCLRLPNVEYLEYQSYC